MFDDTFNFVINPLGAVSLKTESAYLKKLSTRKADEEHLALTFMQNYLLTITPCHGEYSDINDHIGTEDKYAEEASEYTSKVKNYIKKNVPECCDLICSYRWDVYISLYEISFITWTK